MNGDRAEEMLMALGEVLEQQGSEPFDLVVCGGMALVMQDLIARPTRDIDGIALVVQEGGSLELRKPLMSREFHAAVERVGVVYGKGRNWLNVGAISLHDTRLPAGLAERAVKKQYGSRLVIRLCSRADLVSLKMWAALWRSGPDIDDLREMGATKEEAIAGFEWCLEQDGEREDLLLILREIGHGELAERLT